MARMYLRSPDEVAGAIGRRARALRLASRLTQATVAKRAQVGLRTLQRFEDTGLVGVDVMIRIAFALGVPDTFDSLFPEPSPASLDEALAPKRPKRGRS